MLLLIGMLHAETPAFSGGNSSGGGSGLSLEFKAMAYDLYDYFQWLPSQRKPDFFREISLEEFRETIDQCEVRIVDRFSKEEAGDELLTAKNYTYPDGTNIPGGLIEIKENRWRTDPQKEATVLHEILGLRGIDRHYEFSHEFYNFSKNPTIEFLNIFTNEYKKELSKARGYSIDDLNHLNLQRAFLHIRPDGNVEYDNIGNLTVYEFKFKVWVEAQFGITHRAANDMVAISLANTVQVLNPGSQWTKETIFECVDGPWLGFIHVSCTGHKIGEIFPVLNRINDETN